MKCTQYYDDNIHPSVVQTNLKTPFMRTVTYFSCFFLFVRWWLQWETSSGEERSCPPRITYMVPYSLLWVVVAFGQKSLLSHWCFSLLLGHFRLALRFCVQAACQPVRLGRQWQQSHAVPAGSNQGERAHHCGGVHENCSHKCWVSRYNNVLIVNPQTIFENPKLSLTNDFHPQHPPPFF